jgi:hypothetical protein
MRALAAALILVVLAAAACGGEEIDQAEEQAAIAAAEAAYAKARAEGRDLSAGPCLGQVTPNWVADIAHDPRQDVDDDPANQCEEYRSGEVEHFVELDPDGNVIRTR